MDRHPRDSPIAAALRGPHAELAEVSGGARRYPRDIGPKLVAMAGLRMAFDGYREISAVCTDPSHKGRGFAGSLVTELVHALATDGERAFLHTEVENIRAQSLYARLGFEERARLPLWRIAQR